MWDVSIMQTQQRSYYCVWWKPDCTVFQPVAKIPQGRENKVLSKMSSTSQQIGHSSFSVHSSGQTLTCTLDPSQCLSARSCCCSLQAHALHRLQLGLLPRRIWLCVQNKWRCIVVSSGNLCHIELAYLCFFFFTVPISLVLCCVFPINSIQFSLFI